MGQNSKEKICGFLSFPFRYFLGYFSVQIRSSLSINELSINLFGTRSALQTGEDNLT